MISINRAYAQFRWNSPSLQLVIVNVAVFVVLRLIAIVLRFSGVASGVDSVVDLLLLPHTFGEWILAPWTALTYMFVQYEPLHLIMNMLWLYMFGNILETVVSRSRFFATYICGGMLGALCYLLAGLAGNSFSAGLTGASASILAVMASAMVMMPNLRLRLILFGEMSLKVIGAIVVVLVVLANGLGNYSVHAAHLGGFLAGVAMGYAANGKLGTWNSLFQKSAMTKVKPESDVTLDQLLDKIRRSGFNSLTPAERVRLIKISSELQKNRNGEKG